MKKTFITLLALAGMASADTIDLLTDGTWTTGSRYGRPTWVQNEGALTLTNSNWSQAYAVYDFADNVTGSWSFSATVDRFDGSAGFTLTLIGNNQAITIGTTVYESGTGFYGTTTNTAANGYSFQDALGDINGTKVDSPIQLVEGPFNVNQNAVITGYTTLDDDSNVILTLSLGGSAVATAGVATINLGKDFELDKISVWGDGGNNRKNWAVTSLTVTTKSDVVPEPATATLSLLALAGLAARRRRR